MRKKEKMKYIIAGELFILSVIFTLMVITVDVRPIGPLHSDVGFAAFNGSFHNLTGVNMTFYKMTDVLGYLACAVVGVFALIGLIQLIKRKSLKKVDSTILIQGGLYFILFSLYVIFEKIELNYRPIIMPGKTSLEASYPSSHTMLSIVVFLSVAMVINEFIQKKALAEVVRLTCYVFTALAVVGRLLSGVHWLTDIIGGVLISLTLLQIFSAIKYTVDRKEEKL